MSKWTACVVVLPLRASDSLTVSSWSPKTPARARLMPPTAAEKARPLGPGGSRARALATKSSGPAAGDVGSSRRPNVPGGKNDVNRTLPGGSPRLASGLTGELVGGVTSAPLKAVCSVCKLAGGRRVTDRFRVLAKLVSSAEVSFGCRSRHTTTPFGVLWTLTIWATGEPPFPRGPQLATLAGVEGEPPDHRGIVTRL